MRRIVFCAVGLLLSITSFGQDSVGQYPSKNWFNEDVNSAKVNGVSTDAAYKTLEGKKSETVIVAVIDSGIDIDHEDLKDVIWINEDEIIGNGIDDDKNGYVDDIHGWNFIGGADGVNVGADNLEVTREYRRLKDKFENKKPSKKAEYLYWKEIEEGYTTGLNKAKREYEFYNELYVKIQRYHKLMTAYLDVEELSLDLLKTVQSPDKEIIAATNFMGNIIMMIGDLPIEAAIDEIEETVNNYEVQLEYSYNLDYDPRSIIGDNPDQLAEVGYGNNDVKGTNTDNFHGTHVAGIIAAERNNNIGIDGIANNVKVMPIRAVPNGDEHDKDVANAIRYAVDNGAKIINMSFGKGYSPHKEYVDAAVRYAADNDVLLIHAAGNSSFNVDVKNNYPTKTFIDKGSANNWIEVGASSWGEDDQLAASFSNYGKNNVDLFAPGVQIYSTAPNNEYKDAQGTSMASPVTAGVAAILRSYYPDLSATEVKSILMQSSRKFDGLMVVRPGTADEMIDFGDLSLSGGVVNALEAVKLAESMHIAMGDK
jgi:cell wall-associated protease